MRVPLSAVLAPILTLVTLFAAASDSSAQVDSTGVPVYYHFEPMPLPVGEALLTARAVFTMLPEPVVESEIPAPSFGLQLRYGIADDWSVLGCVTTNVVSNIMQLGAQWNDHRGRLSYATGASAVVFYGWITLEETFLRNWAFACGIVPQARIGYRFDEFSVTLAGSASLIFWGESHAGDFGALELYSPLNDFAFTLTVEQPFLRSSLVSIGLALTFSRTPYESWVLYGTFDQFLLLPEFSIGLQL